MDTKNSSDTKPIEISRKIHKHITFRSKQYGNVKLRVSIKLKDALFLLNFLEEKDSIDSKEFTIELLSKFSLQLPQKEFSTWDDKSLLLLANKWAKTAIKGEDGNEIKDFRDFKNKVLNHEKKTNKYLIEIIRNASRVTVNQLAEINNSLTSGITQAYKSLALDMTSVMANAYKAFDVAKNIQLSLIPALPDFKNIFVYVEQITKETNETIDLLEKLGYDHAVTILEDKFANDLLKVKPERQQAVITNRLMKITTEFEFAKEIERLFNFSKLHNRWSPMKQALLAHQMHQYFVSIPIFLAQAEGIFTELLIMRNLAYKEKNKVFALENGMPKKKKKKEEIIGLNTLSAKVNQAKGHFNDEKIIRITADVLVERFVSKRNDILHGRINNYGNAKTSTQTLLLVFTLAGILENDLKDKNKQ